MDSGFEFMAFGFDFECELKPNVSNVNLNQMFFKELVESLYLSIFFFVLI